jgi:soluble lytic murein transglycosylase-like protein
MDLVMRASAHCAYVIGLLVMSAIAAADHPVYCGTERWKTFIAEAATRFAIPQAWLRAVIRAESAGCESIDGHPITSSAGAMGLMQLMPSTWNELQGRLHLGNNPFDPHDNILAGAAYLRELYDRYGSPGFLAAYHAGPERYETYRLGTRSLPWTTLEYLQRVRPERSVALQSSTVFVQEFPRSTGDVSIPLQRTDKRESRTHIGPRVDPTDVQPESAR